MKDIMTEQLAKDIQSKEDLKFAAQVHEELNGLALSSDPMKIDNDDQKTNDNHFETVATSSGIETDEAVGQAEFELVDDGCYSDEAIASMLQKQYDKEYDEMLKRSEEKYNAASKVGISFNNFRRVPEILGEI